MWQRSLSSRLVRPGQPQSHTPPRIPERVDRLVLLGAWAKTEFTPELEAILSMMGSNYRLFTDTLARITMGFATGCRRDASRPS